MPRHLKEANFAFCASAFEALERGEVPSAFEALERGEVAPLSSAEAQKRRFSPRIDVLPPPDTFLQPSPLFHPTPHRHINRSKDT